MLLRLPSEESLGSKPVKGVAVGGIIRSHEAKPHICRLDYSVFKPERIQPKHSGTAARAVDARGFEMAQHRTREYGWPG